MAFEDITSTSSFPIHVIKTQKCCINSNIGPWKLKMMLIKHNVQLSMVPNSNPVPAHYWLMYNYISYFLLNTVTNDLRYQLCYDWIWILHLQKVKVVPRVVDTYHFSRLYRCHWGTFWKPEELKKNNNSNHFIKIKNKLEFIWSWQFSWMHM